MDIQDIFASRLYVEKFTDTTWISKSVDFALNLKEININRYTVRNGWQSNTDLYRNKHFTIFADWALTLIKTKILHDKHTPWMSELWLNVHDQHGYNHRHVHSGSWLAGVLYLKCPVDSGKLIFSDPRPAADCSLFREFLNTQDYVHSPSVGDVVLFPAFLPHLVDTNNSTEPRISLSFNINLD
jgi:uncharacterized protein (TIGR02466 family)